MTKGQIVRQIAAGLLIVLLIAALLNAQLAVVLVVLAWAAGTALPAFVIRAVRAKDDGGAARNTAAACGCAALVLYVVLSLLCELDGMG